VIPSSSGANLAATLFAAEFVSPGWDSEPPNGGAGPGLRRCNDANPIASIHRLAGIGQYSAVPLQNHED
jgi:hypothetical protein